MLILSVVIEMAANTTSLIGQYGIDSTLEVNYEENWFTIG